MPELPEVETVRRDVERVFAGRRIISVDVVGPRTLRRHADPATVPARLQGQRLTTTKRRGKYLLLSLESGEALVVHLGMSGQLRAVPADAHVQRHTHLTVTWDRGPQLRFVDPRTFGEVFLTAADPSGVIPELAHLGFDPLEDNIGAAELGRRLLVRRTKIKPLLMDQRFVAGIGNIYSDEILWEARLVHDRPANGLSRREVTALDASIVRGMEAGVHHRGSSLADEQYRDLNGRIGGYQAFHRVYAREGLPCPRCSTLIVRTKAYGRSTFGCPRCQR